MPLFATPPVLLAFTALLAYLLGSVPFGIIAARIFGLGDPRATGSGNIGATNVLRTGHRGAAGLTLIGDAGKGAVAVLLARWALGGDAAQIAGLAAILGHLFPVWLRFRGGKGVATWLGTLLAIAWPVGLAACAIWLAVAALFRYSSLAALIAAALAPVLAPFLGAGPALGLLTATSLIVIARHRANIARLSAGTEPKLGRRR